VVNERKLMDIGKIVFNQWWGDNDDYPHKDDETDLINIINTVLTNQLQEAEKVIEYYADENNWHPIDKNKVSIVFNKEDVEQINSDPDNYVAGKKARHYLSIKENSN